MILFKKISALALLAAGCLMFSQSASAQTGEGGKNLVKWNALGLVTNNLSFQYERAVGKKISVALSLALMPKSGLPLEGTFKNIIDDDEFDKQVAGLKTGSFSLTPEVRFYVGKGSFRGFYLAPYIRYVKNTYELPFQYDSADPNDGSTVEKSIFLDGSTKTFTGGLMFGSQHKLGGNFYINWWLGAGAGSLSGKVNGTANLNAEEQQELKQELDDFENDLIKLESQVNGNGAKVDITGTGISARLGLAIGFRF
ncbi:MAG: DUF3575 domain-containing protein [Sphingobacteriaceae bacterium]|nr:MAG: DUF3575 domain-containing protein [Sphingobacteriaceae bacterium]